MQLYSVNWDIDIYAASPREAAEKALQIQRDIHNTATHFSVVSPETESENFIVDYIDFHGEENNG